MLKEIVTKSADQLIDVQRNVVDAQETVAETVHQDQEAQNPVLHAESAMNVHRLQNQQDVMSGD